MARGATIYRASLTLALVDRQVYETLELTIAQHPSENDLRLAARIAAFALLWEPGLAFGRGVSTADEPDAWACADDGRILHWIDVGQPESKRIVKAGRRAERVSVVAFGAGRERWWSSQQEALGRVENLAVWSLDDAFVGALAQGLERSLRWSVTLSGGTAFVETAAGPVESSPALLYAGPHAGPAA